MLAAEQTGGQEMSRGRIVAKVVLLFAVPVGLVGFLLNSFLLPSMEIEAEYQDTLTSVITYTCILISSMGSAVWANKMANSKQEEDPGESKDS